MDDNTLFALCIWDEAQGEPPEGRRAVSRVIHNRMALGYESDGTVVGTVLKKFQFSGFWFSMQAGAYTETEFDLAGAEAQAARLLVQAQTTSVWSDCQLAVTDGAIGSSYAWGPQGRLIDAQPRTLLYCNMAISHPAWASATNEVAVVYHHTFFKD